MAYLFNPTTGKLDLVTDPAGSDTQVQFNDGGLFGASANLTYNKVSSLLTNKGDINLDDGGSFTTTLQTITPTANRTISLPDATGTVALVAGSSGNLVWNNAGAYAGLVGSSADSSGNVTIGGRLTNSVNAALSAPPVSVTGTWITTGGTATTTKPTVLIEPTGTTSTAWSTAGTGLGVNAPSGFTGNLLDLQVNGTSRARVNASGQAVFGGIGIDNFTLGAATTGIHSSNAHVFGQLVLNTNGASWSVASGPGGNANVNVLGPHLISFGGSSLATQGGYSSTKTLQAQTPATDVAAPSLRVVAASALSSATTNITGGNVSLIPGNGASGSSGSANGGNVTLDGGQGFGTGTNGNVIIGATRGNLQITDARNIILGTGTGTRIGTATTQKLAFFNATPVVQPAAVTDLTVTATSGTLPTADGTVTIADAAAPTNAELLKYCVELEAKLEAALSRLRSLGLIAT
jgi:hypothetical protein